ncbi:MAG: hypothetical protein HY791_03010 [Deltaproteobacteria bacterium]|nr:hypothetical protein [Deltaproteobacteria bacterium]
MLSIDRSKTPREVVWDAAVSSMTSVLYYRRQLARLERWDLATRLASAFFASTTLVSILQANGFGVWTSAAAAILAIVGPLLDLPERIKTAALLLSRHVADHQRLESLFERFALEAFSPEVDAALKSWQETEMIETERVRTVNERLFAKCDRDARLQLGEKPTALVEATNA